MRAIASWISSVLRWIAITVWQQPMETQHLFAGSRGGECFSPTRDSLAGCLAQQCSMEDSASTPCSSHEELGQDPGHVWASSTTPGAQRPDDPCNVQLELQTAEPCRRVHLQQPCPSPRSIQPEEGFASCRHTTSQDMQPASVVWQTRPPMGFSLPLCCSELLSAGFPQQEDPNAEGSDQSPCDRSGSSLHDTSGTGRGINRANMPSQTATRDIQDNWMDTQRLETRGNLSEFACTSPSPAVPGHQQPKAESASPGVVAWHQSSRRPPAASRRLCLDSDSSPDHISMLITDRTLRGNACKDPSEARPITGCEAATHQHHVAASALEAPAAMPCSSPDEEWLPSTRRSATSSRRFCLSFDSSPELPGICQHRPVPQHEACDEVPGSRLLIANASGFSSPTTIGKTIPASSPGLDLDLDEPSRAAEHPSCGSRSSPAQHKACHQPDMASSRASMPQPFRQQSCTASRPLGLDSDGSPQQASFCQPDALHSMPANKFSFSGQQSKGNQEASNTCSAPPYAAFARGPTSEGASSPDEELQPSIRRSNAAARQIYLDSDSSPEQVSTSQVSGNHSSIGEHSVPGSQLLAPATYALPNARNSFASSSRAGNAEVNLPALVRHTQATSHQFQEAGSQPLQLTSSASSDSSSDTAPCPIRSTIKRSQQGHFALQSSPESPYEALQVSIRSRACAEPPSASPSGTGCLDHAAMGMQRASPGTKVLFGRDSSPDSIIVLDDQDGFQACDGPTTDQVQHAGPSEEPSPVAPAGRSSADVPQNGTAAGRCWHTPDELQSQPPLTSPAPKHWVQPPLASPQAPCVPLAASPKAMAGVNQRPGRLDTPRLQPRSAAQYPAAGGMADQENQEPCTPFTPVARPPRTPAMAPHQTPAAASRTAAKQLAAFRKERAGLARDLYSRWVDTLHTSDCPPC